MQCPKCQSDTKVVPEGVSKKSGKSYPAFIACTNRECDYTVNTAQNAPDKQNAALMIVEELASVNTHLREIKELLRENLSFFRPVKDKEELHVESPNDEQEIDL
ncbi:MAG TPA: hypothetical protein ENI23_12415 [bacterium]|nr:hypothetical protein [bacterium]